MIGLLLAVADLVTYLACCGALGDETIWAPVFEQLKRQRGRRGSGSSGCLRPAGRRVSAAPSEARNRAEGSLRRRGRRTSGPPLRPRTGADGCVARRVGARPAG